MDPHMQRIVSESFDDRAFKKASSTVDNTYKNLKEKTFTNHGICSNIAMSGRPQYGIHSDNSGIEI